MNVKNSESGTDVSSDSSWTVIEEIRETFTSSKDRDTKLNVDIEVIKTTEIVKIADVPNEKDNDFVQVSLSHTSIKQSSDEESENSKDETKENGFLTFDEYLQERMLEHDYDFPSQSVFRKKSNKSRKTLKNKRKCKAETIGVLSLCASLLTVTGIALLCLIFPENIDTKNFDVIKSNCQAISSNESLDYKNIVASLNKTMEVLDAANSSKILEKSVDTINRNPEYKNKIFRRTIGPMNEIRSSRYRSSRRYKNSISSTNLFNSVCYPKNNNGVCYSNEDPRLVSGVSKKQRNKLPDLKKFNQVSNSTIITSPITMNETNRTTALSTIESVLGGTNLKKIIRSIIHDICILKLITYINKKGESQEPKKKMNKGEQKAAKRKLFEAIADGLDRIRYEDNKGRKIRTANRKIKTRKQSPKYKYRSAENTLNVISDSTCKTPVPNVVVQYSGQRKGCPLKAEIFTKFENGKSECERRFEELDNHRKRSQEVCSKHKINIQQIKQQYRNEVDAIKDSNVEPLIRLHKIQSLREKYKLQLKKNREMYMREMSKMKRLRTKMLKDLCTQKKIDLEMKDVAVGSYVVPIEQDFYSRLQQIKNKELKTNSIDILNLPNVNKNEKIEPMFQLPKSSTFYLPSPRSIDQDVKTETDNSKPTECTREGIKQESRICSAFELTPSFNIKPKSSSTKPRKITEKYICSEKGANSIKKKYDDSEDMNTDCAIEGINVREHLYQIAFEKKGQIIENIDNMKWRHKKYEQWEKYKKDSSKHDPQKFYKPNMMLYKY